MEGWLNKKAVRSLFKNNWKRRWVIVRVDERSLSYAKTETSPPVLTLYFDEKSKVENTNEHGKSNEFKVTAKDGLIFFAHAETASQRERWVAFIQRAIEGPRKKIPGPPALPPPPPMPAAPASTPAPAAAGAGSAAAAAPAASSAPPKITSLAALVKTTEDRTAKTMGVGGNDIGQLGTGQVAPSGSAVAEQINALKLKSAAVFVSAGLRYAGAISASNTLFMWGGGAAGQLGGDSSMLRSSRPFLVPAFRTRTVLALACGGSHVLAIVAPAGASAPAAGGAGVNKDGLTMGPLPTGSAVHHGAVGGQLFAFGSSAVGALGLGTETVSSFVPKEVTFPDQPEGALCTYISAGAVTSAAVIGGKSLYVWGDAGYGRLGLGDLGNIKSAVPVFEPTPLELVTPMGEQLLPGTVALGGSFTCYLGRSYNAPPGAPSTLLVCGMIGVDVAVIEDEPGTMERGTAPCDTGTVSISVRKPTLRKGDNSTHSDVIPVPTPTETFGTKSVILTASAGLTHYLVVHRDNSSNRKSQGVAKALLAAAAAGDGAGGAAAAALSLPPPPPTKPRGQVFTAGYGILGHAPPEGGRIKTYFFLSAEPQAVGGALAEEDVVEVAAGMYTSYARNTAGQVFAWGVNEYGGLWSGRFVDIFAPVSCTEPEDAHIEQLAAGPDFLLSLQYNGLLGDVKARALAKNAFSKWRKKAAARSSVAAGTAAALLLSGSGGGRSSSSANGEQEVIGSMLQDIAEEEGIELGGAVGGDLGSIIQHLLREAESAAAADAAEAVAAGGAKPEDEEEKWDAQPAPAAGDGGEAIVAALASLSAEAAATAPGAGGVGRRKGAEEI